MQQMQLRCCCPTMLMEIYWLSVFGLTKFDTGTSTIGRAPFMSLTLLMELLTFSTKGIAMILMELRTCVVGAIQNFTTLLSHYKEGTSDRRHNMTEALLFLSHFMGDIHQAMHCGFTSERGGNSIELRWVTHKSNLHHVWDRDNSYGC